VLAVGVDSRDWMRERSLDWNMSSTPRNLEWSVRAAPVTSSAAWTWLCVVLAGAIVDELTWHFLHFAIAPAPFDFLLHRLGLF
jgi:hypothetical protein